MKDRGADAQRSRHLDDGAKRIAFWDQWLKLSLSLGEQGAGLARQRVQQELNLLCTTFSTSLARLHSEASALTEIKVQFKSKLAGLSALRRALLFYRPARAIAWFPRLFFYLFDLITLFVVAVIAASIHDPDWGSALLGGFIVLLCLLGAAIVFRSLSVNLQKPHKSAVDIILGPQPAPPIQS